MQTNANRSKATKLLLAAFATFFYPPWTFLFLSSFQVQRYSVRPGDKKRVQKRVGSEERGSLSLSLSLPPFGEEGCRRGWGLRGRSRDRRGNEDETRLETDASQADTETAKLLLPDSLSPGCENC